MLPFSHVNSYLHQILKKKSSAGKTLAQKSPSVLFNFLISVQKDSKFRYISGSHAQNRPAGPTYSVIVFQY